MIPPLNGTKTHPLTQHAIDVLRELSHGPIRRSQINPGCANRLLRGGYVETVLLPWRDRRIEHLRITKAGHAVATAGKEPG